MPYDMPLPGRYQGLWKIKIQDKELLYEEPHVTIWRKSIKWRFGLRSLVFLDAYPDPGEVPAQIVRWIRDHLADLHHEWDIRFPANPVAAEDDDHA